MKLGMGLCTALFGALVLVGICLIDGKPVGSPGHSFEESVGAVEPVQERGEGAGRVSCLEDRVRLSGRAEPSVFISGGLPRPGGSGVQHMELRLPDESSMMVRFSENEKSGSGAVNWIGRIDGEPESFFSLSMVGDAVEGYTLSERGEFLLSGTVSGELVLTEVVLPDGFCETCRTQHDTVAGFGDTYSELDAGASGVLAAGVPEVDVLVVYTPLALADAGSLEVLLAKANQMINSLNSIMSSSGAGAEVNLIGIAPVSHPGAGTSSDGSASTLLSRLTNASDGQLDEAHGYREAYGADMVCVFGKVSGYGIANVGGPWSAADYSTAHGVMPHELGHNLGCGHNDSGTGQTSLQGVYSYSYGHYFNYGGELRGTLMSYIGKRSTTFSNPNDTWNGVVTGTATRDHARTIRTFAPTAAGWKTANATDYDHDGIPNAEESGSADADGDGLPDMLDPDNDVRTGFAMSAIYFDLESHAGNDSTVWNSGTALAHVQEGSWVRYGAVDFGFSGIGFIDVEAASGGAGGDVEVRLGGPAGVLIATVRIDGTGGWNTFESFRAAVDFPVGGVHDVYLVFRGGAGYLFDIKALFFHELQTPVVMEAEDAAIEYGIVKLNDGASGGQFVDGSAGFGLAWAVDAFVETTPLDFRVKVPSGTRSMGVFVNGAKQGVIRSASSTWETQSVFSVAMNAGMNTVELRDSEGSAELDVDSFSHYLAGRKLLQWNHGAGGMPAYGWNGALKLQACTNLIEAGWVDVPGGENSPLLYSADTDPDSEKYFRLLEDEKPTVGKSYSWNSGAEAVTTKHMTTSVDGGVISLALDAANNDPYIRLNGAHINGDVYHTVQMRVRNSTDGAAWRIYFKPQGGGEAGNSVPVTVPASGQWQIISLDMRADPDFAGTIDSIRLDQQTLSAGTVEIDYVKMVSTP